MCLACSNLFSLTPFICQIFSQVFPSLSGFSKNQTCDFARLSAKCFRPSQHEISFIFWIFLGLFKSILIDTFISKNVSSKAQNVFSFQHVRNNERCQNVKVLKVGNKRVVH